MYSPIGLSLAGSSTDDALTPRTSGAYEIFLRACLDLEADLIAAALAYERRPDLGYDYGSCDACRRLAERASLLSVGLDSWRLEPPTQDARGRDIDLLYELMEGSKNLIARTRR